MERQYLVSATILLWVVYMVQVNDVVSQMCQELGIKCFSIGHVKQQVAEVEQKPSSAGKRAASPKPASKRAASPAPVKRSASPKAKPTAAGGTKK